MKIDIPYGDGKETVVIPDNRISAIINAKHPKESLKTEEDIINDALDNPIDSSSLNSIASNSNNILIVTSDHTRPMPSKITLPILIKRIRNVNPNINIKILVATGCHRVTTQQELIDKFGKTIVENEEIIIHIGHAKQDMVYKGVLPSGGELWLNKLINWADEIIAEGFIEPHLFAGFSGGRKSILPGIAYEKTIMYNHNSKFISHNKARGGILDDNPIHKDMVFAAESVELSFILNVVLDDEKRIIQAYAGHFISAHEAGCRFVQDLAAVKSVKSDIVVSSNGGYPLDQNIYQAVKGMTGAESCVNSGGVIIMFSSCMDGHGGESFYNWFTSCKSADEITKKILSIPPTDTIADQWEAQILARIQQKCRAVIIVSRHISPHIVENMYMHCVKNFESALSLADELLGKKSKITVIPDGVSVIF